MSPQNDYWIKIDTDSVQWWYDFGDDPDETTLNHINTELLTKIINDAMKFNFFCIATVSIQQAAKILKVPGFVPVDKYFMTNPGQRNEIGYFGNIRFFRKE